MGSWREYIVVWSCYVKCVSFYYLLQSLGFYISIEIPDCTAGNCKDEKTFYYNAIFYFSSKLKEHKNKNDISK